MTEQFWHHPLGNLKGAWRHGNGATHPYLVHSYLMEGNGYETRQSSLLYVIVLFFGLDPAQNTIVVYYWSRN